MSHALRSGKPETESASRGKAATQDGSKGLCMGEPDNSFEQHAAGEVHEVNAAGKITPGWSLSKMGIGAPSQGRALNDTGRHAAAPIVRDVLGSPGQPLDTPTRAFFEPRFQHDFGAVRVHTDARAAESAGAVDALAYTVGNDVVFGNGRYDPRSDGTRRLLAHELAHTVQQGHVEVKGALQISSPAQWNEQRADAAALAVLNARTLPGLGSTGPMIARQGKPAQESGGRGTAEDKPKDTFAGTMISEIVVSLARGRVGFHWAGGVILGDIATDLKPGQYELKPDIAKKQWVIQKPAMKSGLRFEVDLEGANPWTLTYPVTLPLTVAAGSTADPKTFGEMQTEGKLIDPLSLYEDVPEDIKTQPVAGIDDCESTPKYDPSYRSEKGNLSKWLIVSYRDNTTKDINLDSITKDTPRLWAAKQAALKDMDDYNTLFIINTLPAVWFIITIFPVSVPAGQGVRYTATSRQVPKASGGTPETLEASGNTGGGGDAELAPPGGGESAPPTGTPETLKASGKTTSGTGGNKAASAKALAESGSGVAPDAPLTTPQQEIAKSLLKEHPNLNPRVAQESARGGATAAGKGGKGADVPLLNGGGREVSVHQETSPFTADSVGPHLQQEAMQQGTTEIYLQINSSGATREGFLKMVPGIRNGYPELRGVMVKIFGPNGEVWWTGTFGGPQ